MKRILVISNNCFSQTNSNGRTLGNLFYSYDKEKIAQFYISGDRDYSFCKNYYNVTDYDALQSVFPFIKKKAVNAVNSKTNVHTPKTRNVPNMLVRNIIWNIGLWKRISLKKWLEAVNPECILLQIGDCGFLIKFALWVSKKFDCRIIVYNSESYYFKAHNYFNDGHNFLFKIFMFEYKRLFRIINAKSSLNIFLTDDLKELYRTLPSRGKAIVIYNSSEIVNKYDTKINEKPIFSYLGNLDLGRYKELINVSKVIASIDKSFRIQVYGKGSEEAITRLRECEFIDYCGVVLHDDLKKIIAHSDFLLHVESFDPFYIEDSKYGFTGKIAESLGSGKIFVVYCSNEVSCFRYLNNHNAGVCANSLEELKKKILFCLHDTKAREEIITRELALANMNHSLLKNAEFFREAVQEIE